MMVKELTPHTKAVGKFKSEDVYLRKEIAPLKTREAWLKEALTVPDDKLPVKTVKRKKSRPRDNDVSCRPHFSYDHFSYDNRHPV